MNLKCRDGWLGHLWGPNGKCLRKCGAIYKTPDGVTLADALCPAEEHATDPLADRIARRDSERPRLRLVRG